MQDYHFVHKISRNNNMQDYHSVQEYLETIICKIIICKIITVHKDNNMQDYHFVHKNITRISRETIYARLSLCSQE